MKKFFQKLFGKKEINRASEKSSNFLVATLNDKLMPIDRGSFYEDPLDEYLKKLRIGEVTGGGTGFVKEVGGEISFCDLEILLYSEEIDFDSINKIITKLEDIGTPKGSKLKIEKTEEEKEFGKLEGISIHIDGLNLPKEVYENSDINHVISEVKRLIGDKTEFVRHLVSNEETVLYFYGNSFDEMKGQINDFIDKYPLCKGAKIKQIA